MRALLSTAGLARASARHPWRVLGLWLIILVLAGVSASGLGKALTTDANFTGTPESKRGAELIEQRLTGATAMTESIVVHSDHATVDDPAFKATVDHLAANLAGLDGLTESAPNYYQLQAAGAPSAAQLVSKDRHSMLIPVTFAGTNEAVTDRGDAYLDAVHQAESADVQVLTVGDISANKEFNDIASSDLEKAEQFALPITLIILVLVFGALVAAGVPLLLAISSIVVAVGLTALVGRVMDLSFYVVNMITMIGLAVGIDYALFIVTRYREERRHGLDTLEAITRAGATASKAVLFSGITVVFALSGMLLMPSTIFHSLGTGAVLVVIVAVAAMLTLVPAMLSLIGDKIDWPRRRRYDAAAVAEQERYDHETIHRGFWGTVARVVMTHPVPAVVVAVVLLGAVAIPYVNMHRGTAGIETLPPSDTKSAYAILNRDFSAGVLAPYEIVVDAPKNAQTEANIATLTEAIKAEGDFLPTVTVEWNQANDLALVKATLTRDSNSEAAYDTLTTLRKQLIPSAFGGAADQVYVTGSTASNADFFHIIDQYTPVIFVWVLGLSFLLLLLAFRSLVVPVKAILMNLLSVGATYGLMVLIFQKGYLHNLFGFQQTPTIEAWVPIMLFCVLFGLSMDYHVFLLSRIREHYDETGANRTSVAVGLQATARLITGAALIMVVVFAGFAAGRLSAFQQLGFGLGVAVLLDATIVRSVLVPAAMTLLGNANWYLPRWLEWLPDLRIEGGRPTPAQTPAPVTELAALGTDD
ncbi:MAG TPA: MMPL family transporter [Thermomicrobiaceae bacterium]|nr:MMPL family transporter [Thermomicrobiaceae bacterium]